MPRGKSRELHAAVAQQPVVVAIGAASAPELMHYTGGVFDGDCYTDADHEIIVVGYGSEGDEKYWRAKNSWGLDWGEDGYIRIARSFEDGAGKCGIQTWPSYPIKETPNPPPHPPTPGVLTSA